jgi:hypothetical protein
LGFGVSSARSARSFGSGGKSTSEKEYDERDSDFSINIDASEVHNPLRFLE